MQDVTQKKQTNNWWQCPKYQGWGCFLVTVIVGLISIVVFIGFGGPWYHDCDHNDCSQQISYGLYCDDYCWNGHSGPGSGLVIIVFCAVLVALALPYCWPQCEKTPRTIYSVVYTDERKIELTFD